jgi:hypothetical protein
MTPETRLANAQQLLGEWLGEYDDWATEGKMDQYLSDLHYEIADLEGLDPDTLDPDVLLAVVRAVRTAYEKLNSEWEGRL